MNAILGDWTFSIKTPVGTMTVDYSFTDGPDGLVGVATGSGETVELHQLQAVSSSSPDGERVTWTQSITRPMRLNLAFDVVVTGDQLTGFSRAGRLPRSQVTGRRV